MRLHWHLGGHTSLLAGNYHAGYWRGPEGCPPECPGLKPPYTWSEAGARGPRGDCRQDGPRQPQTAPRAAVRR